jgi:valyl-tRNA synthetase
MSERVRSWQPHLRTALSEADIAYRPVVPQISYTRYGDFAYEDAVLDL